MATRAQRAVTGGSRGEAWMSASLQEGEGCTSAGTVPGTGRALNTSLWTRAPHRVAWGVTGWRRPHKTCRAWYARLNGPDQSGPQASPSQQPSQAGSGRPTGPRADRRAGRRGRAVGHREKGGHCLPKPNQGATATMRGILSGETDMPFFSPTAAKTAHWI